ncbi:MAG: DUF438 domain-containing protein [bacterium]
MSELIADAQKRRELLKHMILQLHQGEAPDAVRKQLVRMLGSVPYGDVVLVEQELIREGLPSDEVLKLCDLHTAALKGHIDQAGSKEVPPGHPVDTFRKENRALQGELELLGRSVAELNQLAPDADATESAHQLLLRVNALTDVEKHYARKENLLFPYLEQHEITGPPKVMWGKHDETRELLRNAVETLRATGTISAEELQSLAKLVVQPAADAVTEMIYKEEEILLPMCLDTLTEAEWYAIYRQSIEIGFCLYDPEEKWQPVDGVPESAAGAREEKIQLPSGSFTPTELSAILNTIPFDLTFVDKDDRVRYFTQGRERIFARNRAILGREVKLCHPPKSVHIVEQILEDFHAGRQSHAPFWIELHGRFLHIEYFALRDEEGNYLGTLEVSQDLTAKRKLEGQQRLLSYSGEE